KERERTRDVPIIFLTAAGAEQSLIERAYEVGAADYLVKPVSPDIVRAKVAVFVDLYRKNTQLREQGRLLQEAERRQQELEMAERSRGGETIAWLGTDTDIDDRKRADDERIELLVRERAARFEAEASQKRAAELYVEARAAVGMRDDFLTVAAHELRTPLTTL